MPIDALPTPPSRTDPTTFADRADAWVAALSTWTTQANALAVDVAADEASAAASASAAQTAETNAETAETNAEAARDLAQGYAASAVNAPGTSGTSTTSLTIGSGSKSLTTQTGKAWVVGQPVVIARTSAPTTTWMAGAISAYNSGTGALDVTVVSGWTQGSGTHTDWTISLTAPTPGAIAWSLLTGTPTTFADYGVTAGSLTTLVVGGGATVSGILSASASLAYGSIAAGAAEGQTITVTGAQVGDPVFASADGSLNAALLVVARVSATNTVTISVHNTSGGSLTPTTRTWRAVVIRI